jgi:hypothetical protein
VPWRAHWDDYYARLSVSQNASSDLISASYRVLSRDIQRRLKTAESDPNYRVLVRDRWDEVLGARDLDNRPWAARLKQVRSLRAEKARLEEAHSVLSDPAQRAEYDLVLKRRWRQEFPWWFIPGAVLVSVSVYLLVFTVYETWLALLALGTGILCSAGAFALAKDRTCFLSRRISRSRLEAAQLWLVLVGAAVLWGVIGLLVASLEEAPE